MTITVAHARMLKVLVLLATFLLAVSFKLPNASAQEALGAPFALSDPTGKVVRSTDFKGKWMLIYFGYSHCADLCPTELEEMIDALRQIGPEAKRVQPIFITIDPERDKGQYLRDFVAQFDDRLLGLGGTPQQVASVAANYGIRFDKILKSDGSYSFKHTSNIFVINPEGQYQVTFSHMSDAYMIASKMLELISKQHGS
ncbi:MAG TPA: SCO family protein [Herbaspirillum sp.]|nr:SCO family protein [Herbaspirillum sp.]